MTPDLPPPWCEVYTLDAAELAALATGEVAIEVGGRKLWVGRTEVTQAAWSEVMGENPSNTHYGCGPDLPVERVTWPDAMRYANRLSRRMGLRPAYRVQMHRKRWKLNLEADGFRLPTVEEWTWAVLGDHVLTEDELCVYGNVSDKSAARARPEIAGVVVQGPSGTFEKLYAACDDGYPRLAPVGTFLSPSGLVYDGVGNAEEWVVLAYSEAGGLAVMGSSYGGSSLAAVTKPSEWVHLAGLRLVRSRIGD